MTARELTEADPFLRAVAANPADPLPRLIVADRFDEHGLDAEAAEQRATVERLGQADPVAAARALFLRTIADSPGDPAPRLAFADWLQRRGLTREAGGQRWAARCGRSPDHPPAFRWWHWYVAPGHTTPTEPELPAPFRAGPIGGRGYYNSTDEAEQAFLDACAMVEWEDGEPVAAAAHACGAAPDVVEVQDWEYEG
jgi:uncharacterized protein (TIGR02996 family)